jgi:hypothetical protein
MRSCFASIGGIAVKTGASAVLVESAVMDCESTFATGGGVFAYDGANVTLQGARIERCRAIYAGGMRPSLSHVGVGPSVAWLSPRLPCVASREDTRGPTCDRERQCAL